jgi:hypothetical protein
MLNPFCHAQLNKPLMTRIFFFVLMSFLVTLTCCKKKDRLTEPASIDDRRTVLLKDMDVEHLPSPYFHFEYDALHYVNKISFASEFFVYSVEYEHNRVKTIHSQPNGNTLVYVYNNGQVSDINEFSGRTGTIAFTYHFTYDANHQLVQAFWYKYLDSGEASPFKRADLAYLADGNLASLDLYYAITPGQLSWSSKEEFSDYDSNTNVEDITLLKDFFDAYLFLPQVKLQRNNPMKEHIISDVNEYEISNAFDYQNGLPITKTSLVNQTKGGNGQGPIQGVTHFSYN